MQFKKQFIPPSCSPQKKHKIKAKTKEKPLISTNIKATEIAKDERQRQTKLVTRFEKLS
jgi:hypothetical protein